MRPLIWLPVRATTSHVSSISSKRAVKRPNVLLRMLAPWWNPKEAEERSKLLLDAKARYLRNEQRLNRLLDDHDAHNGLLRRK